MTDPGAGSNYPKMPDMRPEDLSATPSGPAPSTVTRAVQLMYASAVLGVIGIIIAIFSRDTIKEQVLENDPNIENVDTVVTASIVFTVVIGLLFTALWVWLAMMVGKGRNWARIVTWVVAGLGVVFAVFGLFNPTSTLTAILTGLGAIIDIAVIVLLAMRPSSEFFARAAGRR